jgi:NAD(P)-dependent dehydrogenase (short-subunit alcohol dehydrogenase family)
MSEQTIALVTGANKGIGYEIAAGLGALGWSVGVGARDEARRGTAVEKLRAAGVDAFGVPCLGCASNAPAASTCSSTMRA